MNPTLQKAHADYDLAWASGDVVAITLALLALWRAESGDA